jgi:hypothetical protein
MPTCPGCDKTISYDELRAHERYCRALWTDGGLGNRAAVSLESRLESLERGISFYRERLDSDGEDDVARSTTELASK